jgi:hypothetical protein
MFYVFTVAKLNKYKNNIYNEGIETLSKELFNSYEIIKNEILSKSNTITENSKYQFIDKEKNIIYLIYPLSITK